MKSLQMTMQTCRVLYILFFSFLSLLKGYIQIKLKALAVEIVGSALYLDGGETQNIGKVHTHTHVAQFKPAAELVIELIAQVKRAKLKGMLLLGKTVGLLGT